jgi:nitroimidazol reductase NimA-like FMN-containing flavoprotein (pyridoxamine 5'-phosphate oxidase superfamily)
MTSEYEPTERSTVRRKPGRGRYDRELVDRVLDEALICHVGFAEGGQPFVIPTIHARVESTLYLHGSPVSRALRTLADGEECCVTATIVDGIVLARSARQHSLNYRSAMVFGIARRIQAPAEKVAALEAIVEHVVPGRTSEARAPDADETESTEILSIALEEASAKVREGGPVDKRADIDLPVWAGVLPVGLATREPQADPTLPPHVSLPNYVEDYRRP